MSDKKIHKHKKRYRNERCPECREKIDVNLAIENEDYDYVDGRQDRIYVYCPCCGFCSIIKL